MNARFRKVEHLELVEKNGRATLQPYEPRRPIPLDSAQYPGYLPPPRLHGPTCNLMEPWREPDVCPPRPYEGHIPMEVPLRNGKKIVVCRVCWGLFHGRGHRSPPDE